MKIKLGILVADEYMKDISEIAKKLEQRLKVSKLFPEIGIISADLDEDYHALVSEIKAMPEVWGVEIWINGEQVE